MNLLRWQSPIIFLVVILIFRKDLEAVLKKHTMYISGIKLKCARMGQGAYQIVYFRGGYYKGKDYNLIYFRNQEKLTCNCRSPGVERS